MRRGAPAPDFSRPVETPHFEPPSLESLEARVGHLEGMVQGLQDSVHRESIRQGKRIADLEAKMEPDALQIALSENARKRGL